MSYAFRGQGPDESVKMVIRRHPVGLLPSGYKMLGLLLIPWFIFVFSSGFSAAFGWSALLVIPWAAWIGFTAYIIWVSDIYVVTNQRVLTTNQKKLFERVIAEVRYDKVQEISHEVKGIYQNLLHLGTVNIKTAASDSKVMLRDVSNPYEVEQMIAKHIKRRGRR